MQTGLYIVIIFSSIIRRLKNISDKICIEIKTYFMSSKVLCKSCRLTDNVEILW